MLYEISKNDLQTWLQAQCREKEVLVPQEKEEGYLFLPWNGGAINLSGYVNSLKPIKDVFFPQWESLIKYRLDPDRAVEITPEPREDKPVLIFGARPCDAQSILLLDAVFNGAKFQDPYYCRRRENSFIISLACQNPGSTCFCWELGAGPMAKDGADILLIDLEDTYVALSGTDQGNQALMKGPFEKASPHREELVESMRKEMVRKFPSSLDRRFHDKKIPDLFTHPVWDELYRKCLNCGVCTFLCPACHCFDISEEATDREGRRVRNWDSCMFSSFTLHGSGHNPRPSNKERLRQRFLHKFKYFPKNYQALACTGCGRCILKCPVNIDMREVLLRVGVFANENES
ncbi:4Fe-4S dicluster domain-containing protein [Candidatus Formimonas warabiya]|uniref:4Fe-4S ferredoxin-type domain-containing protein n=1 Tax=Formimonas warabiya TaxID=1761012 RepID=A0A3G1KYG0_FORW1|nr:4Fe-4S dicluster domain-containing protein [Candidatus Formimonas warabiya]ATW27516.1 hypothetical protein DCMF_24645 [Candidatus Formimonas warabiya]